MRTDGGDAVLAAVVVAHPDDEILWSGGTILMHPEWQWSVGSLCRRSDGDRAPRFLRAVSSINASGQMADLPDGPDQPPIKISEVKEAVLSVLPDADLELVITHSVFGEYTRHKRHEETGLAVSELWQEGGIRAKQLWMFAYGDGGGIHLPRAMMDAHERIELSEDIWRNKYSIITDIYGFAPDSFEARTVPREEGFWCFSSPDAMVEWLKEGEGE